MEVIPNSYIARVVLAYLYEEKLNKAAVEFCTTSPYLKEEREFVKRGFRPATCISLKLTALFREYGEIQQKVDGFVEKYGAEFDVQHDLPLVRKIDAVLSLLKQLRFRRGHTGEEKVVVKKESRRSTGSAKRKRAAPSPHPSLSSSTPEVGEPKNKRICSNSAFIVLNDSEKNLSNLSHISPIGEGNSSQDSEREDEGDDEAPEKAQEEEEQLDVRKFPSMDLFSQTLLENENYPEKLADLINKGLESSMSTQPDPKEGTSAVREEIVEVVETINNEPRADCQSFNFNFDELISNIVNSAVKDPVFDDMMEDISSKAVKTHNENEGEDSESVPSSETPLKDRLRKTCRKNYNPSVAKRSVKKVRVISDEPYYGGIPEGVDVEQSQPATMAVVKVESLVNAGNDLDRPHPETVTIQSEVTSTADQPLTTAATTQFYVIQPDNTTKLVDINQLQFPTQQSDCLTDPTATDTTSTLIPITGVGIPEHTYYINVPNYYLDPNTQTPVYFNAYPAPGSEQGANNPTISILPEVLPSPDKFLIFPSTSTGTNPVTSEVCTTSALATTVGTSPSTAAINSIYSSFIPLIPKPEVRTTPQNSIIQSVAARCNSTPSRKASHIRILNFHTPAKQSPLAAGSSGRISTPGSAPPSVSSHTSRIPVADIPRLDPIIETCIKQEPVKTPEKASSDLDSAPQIPACNPNSVSNTPRVAKDPRTCVRVLSRSDSDEPVEIGPTVEIPASVVAEVCKKPTGPRIQISDAEMEEWRRIRSVSKSNFDQHLRMMEEQKQNTHTPREQVRRKKKKPPTRKAPTAAASQDAFENATPSKVNDSLESLDKADSSLTELHGQMLEDALASAKKPETGKTPGKTPAKAKTPAKEEGTGGGEQGSKIYVKIATPRKKTPVKTSPKRRPAKVQKSAKKRRSNSPRKKVSAKKKEEIPEPLEQEVTAQTAEEVKVEVKEPDVIVEKEPEPETPVKAHEDSLSQVEVTPAEAPKPIKDHPKLLAKKSSAEYVRMEQEKAAESANTSANMESPPEKAPTVAVENSFGSSLCLDTPFKGDLSSIPITPRFLVPNQVENTPLVKFSREGIATNSSLKKTCEIQTPTFPITPGLNSTPKSTNSTSPQSLSGTGGFNSRRTDYSSGSSYYKPDESEDLDKNLEAMLHGERRKRVVGENSGKESIDEPQPKEEPIIESTPQKPPDPPDNVVNVSSSDSSESSDSSSDSSSSESSPENTPAKQESSPVAPSPEKPSATYFTIYEARRQQQAELEAKKQRTIARMKIAKPPPPLKKTERKFSAPPGFKPRKVVITRSKEGAPKPVVPVNSPRATTSASSKRKNPTPRKVVFLDKILPMSTKKLSPKRKPLPSQGKSSRTSLTVSEQEISKILTPRKDQAIEGTYESENLSRLCCTPDIPDVDTTADKKLVYAFKSPERDCNAEDMSQRERTPDSNKENQSLETVEDSNNPEVVEEDDSGSSEEDEDYQYNDCSFNSFCEEDFVRIVYSDKKSRCVQSSEVRTIKKCNIVLDDRKVCLGPSELLFIFEQLPSPPISSGTRSSSKKAKLSSGEKDPKQEVSAPISVPAATVKAKISSAEKDTKQEVSAPISIPAATVKAKISSGEKDTKQEVSPSAPTIKAKINVISAVRSCAHPMSTKQAALLSIEKQKKQNAASITAKKNKLDNATGKVHHEVPKTVGSGNASEEKSASPSPKMPLKLDMKKKQQHQQPLPSKPAATGNTATEEQTPPLVTEELNVESKEDAPADGQLQKHIQEDEIDAVLTHIHG